MAAYPCPLRKRSPLITIYIAIFLLNIVKVDSFPPLRRNDSDLNSETNSSQELEPTFTSSESDVEVFDEKVEFSECAKLKRISDCLPALYSTAILATVTAFLLALCGVFILCMLCCRARWMARDRTIYSRAQGTAYSPNSDPEAESLRPDSRQSYPSRFDADPPPKYPGTLKLERISTEIPPPPYTPSFKKDLVFDNTRQDAVLCNTSENKL